ncbi:MAG: hypothetical protein VX223_08635 [Myxococcota bacterium]|nr:hypothetical protein [Myxococcota bacterium]
MRTFTLVILVTLLQTGCVKPREILQVPYDSTQRQDSWQKAVLFVQSNGYPITLIDKSSGVLTTDWLEPASSEVGILDTRERVSITVSGAGSLIVNVTFQCRDRVNAFGRFFVCRPDLAEARQLMIARSILGEDAELPELQRD